MTVDDYYAAARALGLRPTDTPNLWYCSRTKEFHNVPDPAKYSEAERVDIMETLARIV